MRDVLLDSELIYGDETTFQVLKEPGRRPQSKSYLWAQVNGSGPPVRMFSYSPGRGAQHAQRLYAGVKPGTVLMTDGYELYNGIARDHQLVHLGCWAHVRRGFIKAEETVPKPARTPDLLATRFVGLIGKLFAVVDRIKSDTVATINVSQRGGHPARCRKIGAEATPASTSPLSANFRYRPVSAIARPIPSGR